MNPTALDTLAKIRAGRLYGIFGAGGSGREVMPLVRHFIDLTGQVATPVFVVEPKYRTDRTVNGYQVMTPDEFLASPEEKFFNVAIGNSKVRERIADSMKGYAQPFTVTAPTHSAMEMNQIGEGALFCDFTLITSNVKIGRFFHCNYFSSVSHDCTIGDFVTFSPGVRCNGHVVIEDHVFVGAGAVIRDATEKPIVIGRGAVIGMGAVVTKSVSAGATVLGNPARSR